MANCMKDLRVYINLGGRERDFEEEIVDELSRCFRCDFIADLEGELEENLNGEIGEADEVEIVE